MTRCHICYLIYYAKIINPSYGYILILLVLPPFGVCVMFLKLKDTYNSFYSVNKKTFLKMWKHTRNTKKKKKFIVFCVNDM